MVAYFALLMTCAIRSDASIRTNYLIHIFLMSYTKSCLVRVLHASWVTILCQTLMTLDQTLLFFLCSEPTILNSKLTYCQLFFCETSWKFLPEGFLFSLGLSPLF